MVLENPDDRRVIKFLVNLMIISMISFPFLFYPVVIMYPCNPPFLGSWLSECTQEIETRPPLIISLFLAFLDMLVYYLVDCDFNFNSTLVCLVIANICLAEYFVEKFLGKSDSTVTQKLKDYQSLQVLIKMQNFCCRQFLTPYTITWACWIHILMTFGANESGRNAPLPMLFNMGVGSTDAFLICLLITSKAAKVFGTSVSTLRILKYKCARDKLQRKQFASLVTARIYFHNNYVDQTTPIVIQDFCVNQIVSITLINAELRH